MKDIIERIQKLIEELEAIKDKPPKVHLAIGGLRTAKDSLSIGEETEDDNPA